MINKATRHVLKQGGEKWDQIYLADYNHVKVDESILWTLHVDIRNVYQCLRSMTNIHLNMDVEAADGHVGESMMAVFLFSLSEGDRKIRNRSSSLSIVTKYKMNSNNH